MLDPMDDSLYSHMRRMLQACVIFVFDTIPHDGESNVHCLALSIKDIRNEADNEMLPTLCSHLEESSIQDLMELCIAPTTKKLFVSKKYMKDLDSHCLKAMTTHVDMLANDVDEIAICTWSNGLNQYNTLTVPRTHQVRVSIIFMRVKVTLYHMFQAISHGHNSETVAAFIVKLHYAITLHLTNTVASQYAPSLMMAGGSIALIPDAMGLYDFDMF